MNTIAQLSLKEKGKFLFLVTERIEPSFLKYLSTYQINKITDIEIIINKVKEALLELDNESSSEFQPYELIIRDILEDTHDSNSYLNNLGRKSGICVLIVIKYLLNPSDKYISDLIIYIEEVCSFIEENTDKKVLKRESSKQSKDLNSLIAGENIKDLILENQNFKIYP